MHTSPVFAVLQLCHKHVHSSALMCITRGVLQKSGMGRRHGQAGAGFNLDCGLINNHLHAVLMLHVCFQVVSPWVWALAMGTLAHGASHACEEAR